MILLMFCMGMPSPPLSLMKTKGKKPESLKCSPKNPGIMLVCGKNL